MFRRIAALVIVGLALASLAAPVMAQEPSEPSTRASVLDQAREALASEAAPPRRSLIERGLYWYDNQFALTKFLAGWKGLRIGGGDFPGGAGMKFGVAFDKSLAAADPDPSVPNRMTFAGRAAYSTRGYSRVSAGIDASNVAGRAIDINAFGRYANFPQEDYFGSGMDSSESDRTNYLIETAETGGSVRWRPFHLDLGAGAFYVSPRVGAGTDTAFASTEEVFSPATTPGLETETEFMKVKASAAFDWRNNAAHPQSGGRYEVTATRFDDFELRQFDFYRLDVDVQQYIPLASRYRVLALRAAGAFTTADDGQSVPFYLQPTLGGHADLRGFRESRFRDNNTLLVGAEYRWEAWWALDAALFVDAGTVAPSRQQLSLRNTEVTYGVGFRFHSNKAVVARLDLAFSREGFIPILRFQHVF